MTTQPVVPGAEPQASRVTVSTSALLSGSGVGALLVFMLQNRDEVTLTFLFWDFTWPVWLLTLLSALIGAFVWLGLGILRRHRRRVARRAARR